MPDFARVCDVWKSFWQVLEDEVLAMEGRSWMLERMAKADVRPAIRELAKALIKSATSTTRTIPDPPVRFDIAKAQEVWKTAELWENLNYPYCKFTLKNLRNETRLIVGISTSSRQVQVDLHLVTLDCPTLYQAKDLPHQTLMQLDLRAGTITKVGYHQEEGYVEFLLKQVDGMVQPSLRVYDSGKVMFAVWNS